MSQLSEYELQRLEHIKRNHEMLVRLGLASDNERPVFDFNPSKPTPAQPRKKKLVSAIAPETLRRSGRVKGLVPDYTHEIVDSFGDDDREVDKSKKKRKKTKNDDDDDDDDDEREEVLESTTAFLRAAREALQQFVSSRDGEAPETPDGWRAEAVQRWGELCGSADQGRDWKEYVTSRLSQPPPPSPLDLLQEYYAQDMWQLLCVCVLMSRVSSWATKHRCISSFFELFPTPSAFLAEVVERNETGRAYQAMASLGLFDDRLKGLADITRKFLTGDDHFAVDLKEHKIRGVGPFGYHSWAIFCRDMGAGLKAEDAALVSFCNWRKRYEKQLQQQGEGGASSLGAASTAEADDDEEEEKEEKVKPEVKAAAAKAAEAKNAREARAAARRATAPAEVVD